MIFTAEKSFRSTRAVQDDSEDGDDDIDETFQELNEDPLYGSNEISFDGSGDGGGKYVLEGIKVVTLVNLLAMMLSMISSNYIFSIQIFTFIIYKWLPFEDLIILKYHIYRTNSLIIPNLKIVKILSLASLC